MARIQLENVKKKFGKVTALDGVTIDVKDNEFFVLFGPAGAGKTTMLNCIAGITLPEEGLIKFDGEIMNLVDPAHRNVAMTFENYALYPQMTVYDNMAAALRSNLYKTDEATIKEKVYKAAKIMKMENLLERLPSQLSNGQKQRVAMGRSLVRNPNVFLMDEPLAHLDAKLRNSMRTELKKIQADLGSTCIYVTHDFLEAMALGDRIAIVKEGRIVQVGSGDEIYYLPCNKFVAQLMGEPQINIIAGKMVVNGGQRQFFINVLGQEVALPMPEDAPLFAKLDQLGEVSLEMGLRPQNIAYRFEPAEGYFKATVYSYESIGNKSVIVAECGGYQVRMIAPNSLHVDIDQAVYVKPDVGHAMFFDGQSENFVGRYAEADYRALANEEA